MCLSDVAHLQVLEERLLADDAPGSLSVPTYLKCLKLGAFGGRIRERDTHYFDTIIPKLTRLDSLYWELDFMPKNFRWFSACPRLKSVHLLPSIILATGDDWMEKLHQLLRFTNLIHFTLRAHTLPHGFNQCNDQHIEPLTALLRSSPNLESIVLNIEGDYGPYSPTLILEPLGSQFIFSKLQTFHMLGDADPDWYRFISTPTHPLRAFLARHPTIQDLGIGCPLEDVSSDGIEPDELSRLLPSVKHLACPLFLCKVVVISKLATQLESLAISDMWLGDSDDKPFDDLLEVMTEDSLPNLRKLAIWDNLSSYSLEVEVLEAFFLAAKGLEELEFRLDLDNKARSKNNQLRFNLNM
ncbi:unnamed protein product [Rhizoctonia solani]|uniref:Uncharacterized protein n=1 Tax=Rhizoctonia solani TaxID=456999 RepID=A0A8H3B9B5_9AGAM|nr:unnamed protein product [Rhizoctonia solani]